MIAAVHATPGQVDHDVGPVEVGRPIADRLGIPAGHLPGSGPRVTAEDDDLMAVRVEGAGEHCPDLPAPPRDNDLHTPASARPLAEPAEARTVKGSAA